MAVIEKIDIYLGEAFKEGAVIKVKARRIPIYGGTKHVPAEKESKKTLIIKSKVDSKTYTVQIKGMKSQHGTPLIGRLELEKGNSGVLMTSSLKRPSKWEVEF